MKPSKVDIVALCQEICDCYDYQITEKEVNFIFSSSFKSFFIFVDPDMIEKTVYNLLSNALKFSHEKGQIILSIELRELDETYYSGLLFTGDRFSGNSLEIKVRDNGKGILPDVMPHIFERFFVNPQNEEAGTGIGLHICQEYTRLNKGNIAVCSLPGKGATFIVNLPVQSLLEFEQENIVIQPLFDKLPGTSEKNFFDSNPSFPGRIILVAEDNDELRIYLKNFLTGRFKVLTAKNGNQAFEIALEVVPDLIISDVLMPGIDGMELISRIRRNPKVNHIPIIILTALSGNNVHIDSINRGADLFLTKPVDESLLLAQIENIIANRDNLIEKYATEKAATGHENYKLTFMEHLEKFILDNIRNDKLDINMLAKEANMSRSSLHRKIKNKANQSATEFIRDIRLKSAAKLMKGEEYNMDEIALLVGFNSTSYFNRSFKEKYGKTPREFFNDLKNSQVV